MFEKAEGGQRKELLKSFVNDLETFSKVDRSTKELKPIVCCACDCIPSCAQWWKEISIAYCEKLCLGARMEKNRVNEVYPEELISQYTVPGVPLLQPFILSNRSIVCDVQGTIVVCKECLEAMETETKKHHINRRRPPKNSIANGYLIGEPPECLKCLNGVERSLISNVRIYANCFAFFGGRHKQIKGWNTFFRNRNDQNVANLRTLRDCGTKGQILVVLCGPFTTTQKALTQKSVQVDPNKVIKAFEWLKANNYHYKDIKIPRPDEVPMPKIIEDNV